LQYVVVVKRKKKKEEKRFDIVNPTTIVVDRAISHTI
jgi:hypothetical protein